MTIKIDDQLKQEIMKGMSEAQRIIDTEMNFSADLRNQARIEKYQSYIIEMSSALVSGELKLI